MPKAKTDSPNSDKKSASPSAVKKDGKTEAPSSVSVSNASAVSDFRRLTWFIFSGLLLIVIVVLVVLSHSSSSAKPITDTWTGKGKDNNWSTSANWTNGVPKSKDSLVFNVTTKAVKSNNNLDNTTFNSIKFVGSKTAYAPFDITGQTVALSGGIVLDSPAPVTISDLKLTANQNLEGEENAVALISTGLNLNGHNLDVANGGLTLSSLEGNGNVSLNKGELEFSTNDKSNPGFSGSVTILLGAQLSLNLSGNSDPLGSGSLNISNGARLLLRLNRSSTLSNPITLGSTSGVKEMPTVQASSNVLGNSSKNSSFTLTFSGNIVLNNNVIMSTTVGGLVPVTYEISHKPSGNFKLLPEPSNVSIIQP